MGKISKPNFKRRKFLEDIELGKHGELAFIELLTKFDFNYWCNVNNLSHLDVYFYYKNLKGTAEVKYDIYQAKSGNLAIEYYNPKSCKPSGIGISKADFWIYVLLDRSIWIVPLKTLKEYTACFPCLRDIPIAGDGNASLKLYNSDKILSDVFTRIDDVKDGETLCSILKNPKKLIM